jgi:hypothetical protein
LSAWSTSSTEAPPANSEASCAMTFRAVDDELAEDLGVSDAADELLVAEGIHAHRLERFLE